MPTGQDGAGASAAPNVNINPSFNPGNFPLPSAMSSKGDVAANWEFFRQQWTDYETATGLTTKDEVIRLATLRSVMGRECLQTLMNLKLSEADKTKVNKCLEALEEYYKPKRNVVYERYIFNSCVQETDESVNTFVTRLRKLAAACEFGALTDELIRDRLVIGLKESSVKARLLREKELDLNKAIQISKSSEAASAQMKKMHGEERHKIEELKKFDQARKRRQQGFQRKQATAPARSAKHEAKKEENAPANCKYCGRNQRHRNKSDCPAYGKTCNACKKKNHFSSVCMVSKKVHHVESLEDSSSEESCLKVEMISLVQTKAKQWFANIDFVSFGKEQHKTQLACQLDTGATCNVISLNDLSAIMQLGEPKLKTTNVKLRLFGGATMKPLGECQLTVEYNGCKHVLRFQVVEGTCKPLLSAETCEELDLIKRNTPDSVHHLSSTMVQAPLSKETLLGKYKDVFHGLGHIGDASIVTDEAVTPVQHSPRRVPVALREDVKKKIQEMEQKGIITKISEPTEWISSMVVVAKPGKIRICLDPRDLNRAVQRPKYQMPTLEEILPSLSKAKVFSTFDAKDGFYQIGLDERSSKLTTFWTPLGRYRYLRMPFGVSLAPEVFECKLQECLADLPGVNVIRDDVLVVGCGETYAEAVIDHDRNVEGLLQRAQQVNLKLNKDKVKLKQTQVKFMGHLITKDGLKPDPEKVTAIENMPKPTSKPEVATLIGFVNYLAKFLPKLSDVAQPLRELTNDKAKFVWAQQHEAAFNTIKQLVVKHPVLKFYDVTEEVTLQTDASNTGLGAVLLQNGQPVAFASRTLSKTEQRYATIEKECLAIVFGCERFYQYLARRDRIHVETDHKPLESIFRKSLLSAPSRLQRMLLRLQRYNLSVTYKPGSQMLLADHLSRAAQHENCESDDSFQVFSLEVEDTSPFQALRVTSERLHQLQQCTGQDEVLQTLKTTVLSGWPDHREQAPVSIREYWNYRDEIALHNGVLFKSHRVIIPKVMRPEIMSRIHSSHLGVEACLRKARDSVFWPNMNAEVKEKVQQCSVCSEFQAKNPKEPMQSHPIPDRPWSRVATDQFVLRGKEYITLVDFYSDFIEVKELQENTSSTVISFLKEQFSRHGIPDTLVTDNGPQYTSHEFRQFARNWEFVHVSSSPHHHRGNGKVEAAVKTAKSVFKKAIKDDKDPWLALLDQRNTPTEQIGSSPAQRLMSRRTRTLLPTSTSLLHPKVPENVEEKLRLRRRKAKIYFDRSTKQLPDIQEGQDVRVAPLQKSETWKRGTCVSKLSDRSYLVATDDSNKILRRNREFLRPAESSPPTELETTQPKVPPEGPANIQQADSTKPAESPTESLVPDKGTLEVKTRTRVVKPPARFKDYVT